MIIDAKVETEPRAWLISKVNRISPNGICRVTLAQDIFDQHRDYIEKDSDGNIIAMWANYWSGNIEPTPAESDDPIPSTTTAEITCSGKKQFKVGGSAKTFTVKYYDEDGNQIDDHLVGRWEFVMDNLPVPDDLISVTDNGYSIKVKFLGDDTYIGKILTITNITNDTTASIQIDITAL
jgi:hypothetical protein